MERKFELSRAIYKLELNSQFSLTAMRCVCFRMELVGCSFTVLLFAMHARICSVFGGVFTLYSLTFAYGAHSAVSHRYR